MVSTAELLVTMTWNHMDEVALRILENFFKRYVAVVCALQHCLHYNVFSRSLRDKTYLLHVEDWVDINKCSLSQSCTA